VTARGLARGLLCACVGLTLACHAPASDPVVGVLDEIAEAARARDAEAVLARLSPGFAANGAMTRDEIGNELRRSFALYESLEVGLVDVQVERTTPTTAVARFRASLAGKPKKVGGLAGLLPESERLRFEVSLADQDGWRVSGASWERLVDGP
jgi:hypothetical protein